MAISSVTQHGSTFYIHHTDGSRTATEGWSSDASVYGYTSNTYSIKVNSGSQYDIYTFDENKRQLSRTTHSK